jgi:hypothetical protein
LFASKVIKTARSGSVADPSNSAGPNGSDRFAKPLAVQIGVVLDENPVPASLQPPIGVVYFARVAPAVRIVRKLKKIAIVLVLLVVALD